MELKQTKILNYGIFFFFIVLLMLGGYFFKDYGVSWDEPIERENGIFSFCAAYHFLTGDSLGLDLTQWSDRYYGNGLQHIFLLADYLCGCFCVYPFGNTMSWLLRHWLTFMFMLTGLFFMYRTGCLLWHDKLKALLPVILFLFMPRFAAESFYNAKDMGLLAGMMIGGCFMVRYALHTTWKNALFLGIAAAFVCSIRLVGLQLLAAGVGIALFMNLLAGRKLELKQVGVQLFVLLVSFVLFITLFYPACWSRGPIAFFSEAVAFMAEHPWRGNVRFCGQDYSSGTTPWYYLIVWIGITTPLPVLFLLAAGSVCILKKSVAVPVRFFRRRTSLVLLAFFLMFWCELLLLPLIMKNYYNGWRHFYFLGYPMLMLAGCGLINLFHLAMKRRILQVVLAGTVIIISGLHVTWMITQHPYQYLYFNILAGEPQRDFELDYWHVSNCSAIRRILQRNVNNPEVKTLAYDYTTYSAIAMLDDEENKKIKVVSRYGFHDYAIIINDGNWHIEKYKEKFPLESGRKMIYDETVWVKNSLWTKQVMAYRIIEFERNAAAKTKPVRY